MTKRPHGSLLLVLPLFTAVACSKAECLATVLDAPYAPAAAKGNLQPLAKPGQACKQCFFNGRCALLFGKGEGPCCDYADGTRAGAWGDDGGKAARCLVTEAHVPFK